MIDWSGGLPGLLPVTAAAYGTGAGNAQGSWVKPFGLDLAADAMDPNADLQVVLPPAAEALAFAGGKGRV